MTGPQALGWAALGTAALTAAAVYAWPHITRAAHHHIERLLTDALDHDPWDHMDDLIDREHRLLTEHPDHNGTCPHCGTTWPCIPLRTLGITRETA